MTNPRPLAAAHLLWGLEMGGIQRSLLSLARHGAAAGLRTRVIAFHGGAAAPLLEEAGCPVAVLPKRPGFDRTLTARLASELARERPDLLHCHDFTACFWATAPRAASVSPRGWPPCTAGCSGSPGRSGSSTSGSCAAWTG